MTSPNPTPNADAPRVLVVEDDQSIRHLVSFVLQRAGYAITSVNGRSEAEATIAGDAEPFAAAVVDLCLPDGRGDEVVQFLREQSPQTRVVIISAYAHASLTLQVAAESGDALLTKPFSNAELLEAVSR